MAITRRTSAFDVGGNSTVANITIPSGGGGVQVGDLMVLEWSTALNTAGWTDPAGWTLEGTGNSSNSNFGMRIFTRVAQSGDAGSTVTCTTPGATRHHVNVVAYYDSSGGAVEKDGFAISNATDTFTMPTLSTSVADCVGVGGAGVRNTGVETWTPPSGGVWVEVGEGTTSSGTGGKAATFAERLTTVSSGTNIGGGTYTPSAGTQGVAWVMALRIAGQSATVAMASTSTLTVVPLGDVTATVTMASSSALSVTPLVTHPVVVAMASTSSLGVVASVPGPYDRLIAAMNGGAIGYVSHRGGASLHPENTLWAYQQTVNNGFVLETDCYYCASGGGATPEERLVLAHDSDPTQVPFYESDGVTPTASSPLVTAMTRATFDTKLVPQPGGGTMRSATGWDDLADFVQANERVVMPESKATAAVQPMIDSITGRGMDRYVITQSFTYSHCTTFAAAGLPTLWLTTSFATNSAATVKAAGIDHVGWQAGTANFPTFVAAAHGAGIKVWVYTVNSRSSADSYIADGADGILTNRPDLVSGGVEATVTMASTSSLAVTPLVTHPATVTMAQGSTLAVSGQQTESATVTMAQTSALAVTPLVSRSVTVAMVQSSTLATAGLQTIPSTVTIASTSTLTVAVSGSVTASVAMDQTSTLAVAAAVSRSITVAMAQTSALAVTVSVTRVAFLAFGQSSLLSVAALLVHTAVAAMAQTSALSVVLVPPVTGGIAGVGSAPVGPWAKAGSAALVPTAKAGTA